MENIEQKALATYHENLQFLEKNNLELFNKINTFSYALDQNLYQERYCLEYLEEKNEFDIFDNTAKSYIYNKDPLTYNQNAINQTNHDMNNAVFLNKDIFANIRKIDFDSKQTLEQKAFYKTFDELNEYRELFPNEIKNKQKKIDKFVFAGTLLGTHIEGIHKKINASIYFIYEVNLEIFRLSLFCTKYFEVAKESKLIFSVMENDKLVENKIFKFLRSGFESSYMVKFYSTQYNSDKLLEAITKAFSLINPLNFPHYHIIELLLKRGSLNVSKYNTLDTKQVKSILKNKPLLYLAAGPSLGKNMEWVKENKDYFFIASIGAAAYKLIENEIIPDIIISIDSKEKVLNHFPESISDKLKNIIFIASAMTNEKVLSRFNSQNTFMFETSLQFKDSSSALGGYAVGEIGLSLLLNLGADKIYTLGNDLALDKETGSSHFAGYVHENKIGLDKKQEQNIIHNDTKLTTKGNFCESIITTVTYIRSIVVYNQIVNQYLQKNNNIKIYNLSDGAYIDNTIPTKISEVKIDKTNKKVDLKEQLNQYSSKGFTEKEKIKFKQSIHFIDTIKHELKSLQEKPSNSYTDFVEKRKNIFDLLLVKSNQFGSYGLYSIFSKYITLSEQYLYFVFNSELENEKDIIKKVEKVWIQHILNLCIIYEDTISTYL